MKSIRLQGSRRAEDFSPDDGLAQCCRGFDDGERLRRLKRSDFAFGARSGLHGFRLWNLLRLGAFNFLRDDGRRWVLRHGNSTLRLPRPPWPPEQNASIEMIEAVGDRYGNGYFAKVDELPHPQELIGLEAILCPNKLFIPSPIYKLEEANPIQRASAGPGLTSEF